MQRDRTLVQLREQYGVHINFVPPMSFQGGKVWCIGSRLYPDRPENETFHEFLLSILRETLGEHWRVEQAGRENKHVLMRCFDEYGDWKRRLADENEPTDGVWSAEPSGWVRYLITVAWDVVTLVHACPNGLPDDLVERLRQQIAFQGARYELSVAALFARLDCEIDFLDEREELRGKSRAEFVACHRPTGQQFAVEAKSRHRPGVLNEQGEPNEDDPLHVDARQVRALFRKALDKDIGDLPYLIFIDINAPIEEGAVGFDKEWVKRVRKWVDRLEKPTAENPDRYNGLFVTNFAPHYQGDEVARPGEWICVLPGYTVSVLSVEFLDTIGHALNVFDRVPEIGMDGQIH